MIQRKRQPRVKSDLPFPELSDLVTSGDLTIYFLQLSLSSEWYTVYKCGLVIYIGTMRVYPGMKHKKLHPWGVVIEMCLKSNRGRD